MNDATSSPRIRPNQAPPNDKTAVIVVHGVAATTPLASVEAVANMLRSSFPGAREHADAEPANGYQVKDRSGVYIRHLAMPSLTEEDRAVLPDLDLDNAQAKLNYMLYEQEEELRQETRNNDLRRGITNSEPKLTLQREQAKDEGIVIHKDEYVTTRVEMVRKEQDREVKKVDLYECYWADLSRGSLGPLAILTSLFTLIYDFCSLGRLCTADYTGKPKGSPLMKVIQVLQALYEFVLCRVIPMLNGALLALLLVLPIAFLSFKEARTFYALLLGTLVFGLIAVAPPAFTKLCWALNWERKPEPARGWVLTVAFGLGIVVAWSFMIWDNVKMEGMYHFASIILCLGLLLAGLCALAFVFHFWRKVTAMVTALLMTGVLVSFSLAAKDPKSAYHEVFRQKGAPVKPVEIPQLTEVEARQVGEAGDAVNVLSLVAPEFQPVLDPRHLDVLTGWERENERRLEMYGKGIDKKQYLANFRSLVHTYNAIVLTAEWLFALLTICWLALVGLLSAIILCCLAEWLISRERIFRSAWETLATVVLSQGLAACLFLVVTVCCWQLIMAVAGSHEVLWSTYEHERWRVFLPLTAFWQSVSYEPLAASFYYIDYQRAAMFLLYACNSPLTILTYLGIYGFVILAVMAFARVIKVEIQHPKIPHKDRDRSIMVGGLVGIGLKALGFGMAFATVLFAIGGVWTYLHVVLDKVGIAPTTWILPLFAILFLVAGFIIFRPLLQVTLDVANWLKVTPYGKSPQARMCSRLYSLIRFLRLGGYQRIVILSHSQGTVLAVETLRHLALLDRARNLNGPSSLSLFTMGSPLRQLYSVRFPWLYDWVRTIAGESDPDRPDATVPNLKETLGVTEWINAYGAADYVGRNILPEAAGEEPYAPDHCRQSTGGPFVEYCIGEAAHTHYWDRYSPRIAYVLDDLVRSRPLAEIHQSIQRTGRPRNGP